MGVEHPQRAEGHVRTDQPARCLTQLQACAATMSGRPDTYAALAVEQTGPGVLTLRVEAIDHDALRRVQRLVADRLQETGGPGAPQVTWQGAEATPRPRHRAKLGITAVVVLVVAAHLGLGGLLLASTPWKHWALGAVVAVVVTKSVFLLLRRRRARRLPAGAPAAEGAPHGPDRRRRARRAAHDRL
ncbi:hypothetical protein PV392_10575 [Streptomyces sp. ME03-5709C]|nr:hypothetical protein [Streptomyces sp. ME03-5709C]